MRFKRARGRGRPVRHFAVDRPSCVPWCVPARVYSVVSSVQRPVNPLFLGEKKPRARGDPCDRLPSRSKCRLIRPRGELSRTSVDITTFPIGTFLLLGFSVSMCRKFEVIHGVAPLHATYIQAL